MGWKCKLIPCQGLQTSYVISITILQLARHVNKLRIACWMMNMLSISPMTPTNSQHTLILDQRAHQLPTDLPTDLIHMTKHCCHQPILTLLDEAPLTHTRAGNNMCLQFKLPCLGVVCNAVIANWYTTFFVVMDYPDSKNICSVHADVNKKIKVKQLCEYYKKVRFMGPALWRSG